MPFRSGKRISGASMTDSSRSTSGRVSQAGRNARAPLMRARGSGQLGIPQPIITGISVVLTTSFTIDLAYNNAEQNPATVFAVATLLNKQPSPAQIVAGEDAIGDTAAEANNAAVTLPTDSLAMIGLTTAVLYFVFVVVREDANLRYSIIASDSQLTA